MNDFCVEKEDTIITEHCCILVGFSDRCSIFRRWSYFYYSVSVGKGTERGELGEKVEFEEREREKGGGGR